MHKASVCSPSAQRRTRLLPGTEARPGFFSTPPLSGALMQSIPSLSQSCQAGCQQVDTDPAPNSQLVLEQGVTPQHEQLTLCSDRAPLLGAASPGGAATGAAAGFTADTAGKEGISQKGKAGPGEKALRQTACLSPVLSNKVRKQLQSGPGGFQA